MGDTSVDVRVSLRGLLGLALLGIEAIGMLQHLVRHIAVVVDHLVFSDPVEGGHGAKMGMNCILC